MPFQLSPGVVVTETDPTTIVPAVQTSVGAFVGNFQWGPVNDITTVESENKLVSVFGGPDANTAVSFFSAANFLAYSNDLKVVRVVGANTLNAVGNASASGILITNEEYYDQTYPTGVTGNLHFIAKYPGSVGNSIKVSMADAATYSSWLYSNLFIGAPDTSDYTSARNGSYDELHVVILDSDGGITGTAGQVLETFPFVSKAFDAKAFDGSAAYYKDVLNRRSKYVWWGNHPAEGTNWGSAAASTAFANLNANVTMTLSKGQTTSIADANLTAGWSEFVTNDTVDVNFLIGGAANATVAQYMIQNVAEVRKDCIAFVSPSLAAAVNNAGDEADDVVTYRNSLPSSSYAVLDSGWKYQYDRYRDGYIWVPLNADIAGVTARVDASFDPWFSPGGVNRGQIKNVVKLAWNPSKANRDTLYVKGVNPVVTMSGQGTLLYGDKTLLSRPSAFDRINVRRLFIVIEKAIAKAAQYSLFEFNDEFTRANFVAMVEPYLRNVQGRRGITDFRVVCNESNNTPDVIDRNEFVADIYIKPARSINFITLNFVAARTGINFSEIGA